MPVLLPCCQRDVDGRDLCVCGRAVSCRSSSRRRRFRSTSFVVYTPTASTFLDLAQKNRISVHTAHQTGEECGGVATEAEVWSWLGCETVGVESQTCNILNVISCATPRTLPDTYLPGIPLSRNECVIKTHETVACLGNTTSTYIYDKNARFAA